MNATNAPNTSSDPSTPSTSNATSNASTSSNPSNPSEATAANAQEDKRGIIFCDGASRGNPGPAAYGFYIRRNDPPLHLAQGGAKIGIATNNIAEYQALIAALKAARNLDLTHIQVNMDSQLVIRQMRKQYRVKNAKLKVLHHKATQLASHFSHCDFQEIARKKNDLADELANNALDRPF